MNDLSSAGQSRRNAFLGMGALAFFGSLSPANAFFGFFEDPVPKGGSNEIQKEVAKLEKTVIAQFMSGS